MGRRHCRTSSASQSNTWAQTTGWVQLWSKDLSFQLLLEEISTNLAHSLWLTDKPIWFWGLGGGGGGVGVGSKVKVTFLWMWYMMNAQNKCIYLWHNPLGLQNDLTTISLKNVSSCECGILEHMGILQNLSQMFPWTHGLGNDIQKYYVDGNCTGRQTHTPTVRYFSLSLSLWALMDISGILIEKKKK